MPRLRVVHPSLPNRDHGLRLLHGPKGACSPSPSVLLNLMDLTGFNMGPYRFTFADGHYMCAPSPNAIIFWWFDACPWINWCIGQMWFDFVICVLVGFPCFLSPFGMLFFLRLYHVMFQRVWYYDAIMFVWMKRSVLPFLYFFSPGQNS